MASVSLFVFFLVSYLGLLLSAEPEEKYSFQNCRPSLGCGDLESLDKIGFPFANTPLPNCGVGIVSCNNETKTIQLAVTEERRYELTSFRSSRQPNSYVLGIWDQALRENWHSGRCESLTNSTIPRIPFISFQIISHNRTFAKCHHTVDYIIGRMQSSDIKCLDNYKVYDLLPSDPFPSRCSIIQLPITPQPSGSTEPYPPIVSGEFELQVNVSDDCSRCHETERQCQLNLEGTFYCPKKGTSKVWKIALGVGCPAIVIIIICLGLCMWRSYKKKNASTNFLARNSYAVQSSRSDLEGRSVYFGVLIFPYSELQEATNNFDDEKELGDGGFGLYIMGNSMMGGKLQSSAYTSTTADKYNSSSMKLKFSPACATKI